MKAKLQLIIAALLCAFVASAVIAQSNKTEAPASEVPYKFERGYPTEETTQRTRDDAGYQRALVAYHFWYPTVSVEGIFYGTRQVGIQDNQAFAFGSCSPGWVTFTANPTFSTQREKPRFFTINFPLRRLDKGT